MAKGRGAILGIIAILLGASGLGFGLVSWLSLGQVSVHNSWYDTKALDSVSQTGAYINDLSITMNLGSGETVYVLFTCTVECSGYWAEFYIYIDGIRTNGHTRISRDSVPGHLDYSAAIQHINNTLSAGAHTITVWAHTDDFDTDATDCVLFVQTLAI